MKFSSLIIDGTSETRAVSFDPVQSILNVFSTELYFVSFEIILGGILSATFSYLSIPEKFMVSLLEIPSEVGISP